MTVAVSDKDSKEFREEGGSGSTQDAAHFATQHDEDVSIEASLLVQGKVRGLQGVNCRVAWSVR